MWPQTGFSCLWRKKQPVVIVDVSANIPDYHGLMLELEKTYGKGDSKVVEV